MKNIGVRLAFLIVAPVLARTQDSAPLANDAADSLRQLLERTVQEEELVGLQATILKGKDTVLSTAIGFANLDHRVPMTSNTRVHVASVAKALTGIVYLRLIETGKIDPEADVRTLVPEFPAKAEGAIRLRHLVGQTHGIRHYRDEVFPTFFTTYYPKLEDALPIFAEDPLRSAPGESYTYSSYAYTLLGVALERATDEPFESLVRTQVLDRAHMTRTLPNDVRRAIDGRASCYSFYDFRWPFRSRPELVAVPPLDFSYNGAGGNLLSTTDDLASMGRCLIGGELVSAASLERLMKSQQTNSGRPTGWSHGWFVIGQGQDRELRINGSNPGAWAHLRVYPERELVIALATNTWGRTARERPRGLMGVMDEL